MTLRIYAGIPIDTNSDDFVIVVEEQGSGIGVLVEITGNVCHIDLSTVSTTSDYTSVASDLQNELNGNVALTSGYSVSFDTDTLKYTISHSSVNFTLKDSASFTSLARNTLGLTDLPTSETDSHTSDQVVHYALKGELGAASQVRDDFEQDGFAEDAFSADGGHYGIYVGTVPKMRRFVVPHEQRKNVYSRESVLVPWTYQDLFEHVRNTEPVLVVDDRESTVQRLTADSAMFSPDPVEPDWDERWDISFETVVAGRLDLDFLLKEDGDLLLNESGGRLILD